MNKTKEIKTAIETQRRKLDHMAEKADCLTALLEEAQQMDRLIEEYYES